MERPRPRPRPRFETTYEDGKRVLRRIPESKAANDDAPESPGRRGFLFGAAAASAVALTPSKLADGTYEAANDERFEPDEPVEDESVETIEVDESFERELEGYEAFVRLRKDEVLFVDVENRPVGAPVPFQDFVDEKDGFEGQYLYTPGQMNEVGFPEGGIAPEWLNYVQARVQAEYPDRSIDDRYHTVTSFRAAYLEDDEPALVAGIANGEITTYKDIIRYFSQKPVVGAEEYTREQYVSEEMQFMDWRPATDTEPARETPSAMSETVAGELRRIMPGLCAQESKFNNDVTSTSGAKGIFQFMPNTWAEYGGQPEDLLSLRAQVAIAGRHFASIYRRVLHHVGPEALEVLKDRFPDEESFERDLLVPLIVNSYNAGSARVAEAARLYVEQVTEWGSGKGIFLDIADFAESSSEGEYLDAYGPHAREYVTRIYAQANVLNND